jgi:hypothetical protein
MLTHCLAAQYHYRFTVPGARLQARQDGDARLCAGAEAELGDRFDPHRFHDTLLNMGSVPLPAMEAEMLEWIAAEKTR